MKTLLQYNVYVPLLDERGKRRRRGALTAIKADVVKFFGGLTETGYRNLGLWRIGAVTIKDEITIWTVLSDRGRTGEKFIKQLIRRLEK